MRVSGSRSRSGNSFFGTRGNDEAARVHRAYGCECRMAARRNGAASGAYLSSGLLVGERGSISSRARVTASDRRSSARASSDGSPYRCQRRNTCEARRTARSGARTPYRVFNSSCRQRRGDRSSYRQCAGIGCHRAKHFGVTALLCSLAPHYATRRRRLSFRLVARQSIGCERVAVIFRTLLRGRPGEDRDIAAAIADPCGWPDLP